METIFRKIFKNPDLIIAVCVVGVLTVMVVPMPSWVIDLLISLAIGGSIVLLLSSVYAVRTLDLSVFPTLLLMMTLFRLSLNVATTRVILLRGANEGTAAAGELIRAFGDVVVGGNYAVGIVVFIILVIINFIVITKGAGRVAEVAARFTLDAMPGKQMAIDADLNAGTISEEKARQRREDISKEADFYGAMDGASKFVRGDAVAGMLIVLVNIIGGIVIGTFQRGLSFGDAVETFTLLTIGDGLVSQFPALIISTAAGIIVTRTASGNNLGTEVANQLFRDPKAIWASAGVMGFLAVVPGLPAMPFIILGGGLSIIGLRLRKKKLQEERAEVDAEEQAKLKPNSEDLESLLNVDLLELEVGYGLINIVDADQNGDLLQRITSIRKQFALELGMIVPPLRIRDNLELKPGEYQVLLKGIPIGRGSLMTGHLLAMDPGNVSQEMAGVPTKEPAFGLDALWIPEQQKDEATLSGYTVVDLSTVIATHLTELVRQHAHELLGRQELQGLLDTLKETAPKVVDDLVPNVLNTSIVLKVLKTLLKEGVSIRDMRTILETLTEYGGAIKDPDSLTEFVRSGLGRSITQKLVGDDQDIPLITLEKSIEETIASSIIQTEQGQQLSVDPEFVRNFVAELNNRAIELAGESSQTIILCSPAIRRHLKKLVDRFIPNVVVLSHNEISQEVNIRAIGTVRLSHAG